MWNWHKRYWPEIGVNAENMSLIQKEGLDLFIKKNADYGDSYKTYGSIGVIVRIGDKINRLNSITSSSISMIDTESMRDTLIDLHNYSAMAIMLLDSQEFRRRAAAEHII